MWYFYIVYHRKFLNNEFFCVDDILSSRKSDSSCSCMQAFAHFGRSAAMLSSQELSGVLGLLCGPSNTRSAQQAAKIPARECRFSSFFPAQDRAGRSIGLEARGAASLRAGCLSIIVNYAHAERASQLKIRTCVRYSSSIWYWKDAYACIYGWMNGWMKNIFSS